MWFSHASGIIMSTACGSDRPPRCSSSRASSNDAESDASGVTIGNNRSSPAASPCAPARLNRSDCSIDSRARIQLRLPITVLISPLCAMNRYGWASGHDGKVLVEKREWTTAMADSTRSSVSSGKNRSSWSVVSIPL